MLNEQPIHLSHYLGDDLTELIHEGLQYVSEINYNAMDDAVNSLTDEMVTSSQTLINLYKQHFVNTIEMYGIRINVASVTIAQIVAVLEMVISLNTTPETILDYVNNSPYETVSFLLQEGTTPVDIYEIDDIIDSVDDSFMTYYVSYAELPEVERDKREEKIYDNLQVIIAYSKENESLSATPTAAKLLSLTKHISTDPTHYLTDVVSDDIDGAVYATAVALFALEAPVDLSTLPQRFLLNTIDDVFQRQSAFNTLVKIVSKLNTFKETL